MDLQQYDTKKVADEGAWMEVYYPDGTPSDARIKLAGLDSQRYQEVQREIQDRRLKASNRQGRVQLGSAAQFEAEALDRLVKCTLDWEGIEDNGQALGCTDQNARWLYESFPWIKDQADIFVGDRSNFLPSSPSGSQTRRGKKST
jgi:hypothetical protein